MDWRNDSIEWLNTNNWQNCFAVTLTFRDRFWDARSKVWMQIDEIKAMRNMRHFINRLNKQVYGNAARRFGKKVRIIPMLGGGRKRRLHYHLIIKVPTWIELKKFKNLVKKCWSKTTFGNRKSSIDPVRNEGWLNYIHEKKKEHELDIENLNWR